MQDAGFKIQDAGFRIQDTGCRNQKRLSNLELETWNLTLCSMPYALCLWVGKFFHTFMNTFHNYGYYS